MDKCSYFLKDKAIFGSYPSQETVYDLEKKGVKYFINLTYPEEKLIKEYETNNIIINYPIKDRKVPNDIISFSKLIVNISNIIKDLKENELIYIHCKGGHGRSGILVACLLCYIFKISPIESIELTTKYHNNRSNMKEKWREIGSPQTFFQKNFVCKTFKPIYFFKANKIGNSVGFSNFSLHSVNIDNLGTFHTSEAVFQTFKNINNRDYVLKQQNTKSPFISKLLGSKIKQTDYFNKNKENIMYNILFQKFTQHSDIKQKLLESGLRPIIYTSKSDYFWGIGNNNTGQNILGKLLEKLRLHFLLNL